MPKNQWHHMQIVILHVIATYGTMHRKANEVFVCICEGFACASLQNCHVYNKAVYTVYPVWFIFNLYFLILE